MFTIALMGMSMLRKERRGKPRAYPGIPGICIGLGLMTLLSCGGVTGSGGGTTPVPVSVNPGLATLFADETGNSWPAGATQQQFTANQTVSWAVTGGSANGTVDATGLYSAPAVVPNPVTVTVAATSATGAGSAFVSVATPTALGTSQITATAVGGMAHADSVTLTVQ